ncbi:hypothetical protein F0562_006790 [Nyssa sinensis]|uniref:Pentacotripeptide-repeat region of PRORP domain-containing protein n=1 Tax=Nyssa sinensis TaxID=561372 RepID=A0A5J5APE7_9ASTE|nr:hypothetical protein F0562_006790 [Nyssa sinensis]
MLRRSMIGFFCRYHSSVADMDPISLLLRRQSLYKSIRECKQIHANLIVAQAISGIYVTNTMLNLYAKCGDLYSAHFLFDQMPQKNVVTWTSLVSSYVHHGYFGIALQLFKEMRGSNERPNQYTLSVVVRACTHIGFVQLGLQTHGLVVHFGFERDEFAGSSLVDFYFKIVCDTSEVLRLLSKMRVVDGLKPNDFTFTTLLKCCCLLREVEQIHVLALKFGSEVDVVVGSALVDMYGKCGDMYSGQKVLNSMEVKDSFVWSSIISGYARNGSGEEAIILFRDMCRQGLKPDQHALTSALKACSELGDFKAGIQLHSPMIKNGFQSDCFVASVLLTLYADANDIFEAEKLFRRIDDRDIVAWNSMIMGYALMEEESASSCINVFRELCRTTTLKPDGATLIALLKSCQSISDLVAGIQIHTTIIKSRQSSETSIGNAVISMYFKCGAIDDAYKAFDDIVHKDEVSWSSIIGCYQKNGFNVEALRLCKEMLADGIHLTSFSLPSCIVACSELAAIDMGQQFHSFIVKFGFNRDVYVGSSIIDMYAKCGNMGDSEKAFEEQPEPNEVTFNALISGFAQHGKASQAIRLFEKMEKMNLVPNQITFLAVLSACSHAGLIKESLFFFDLMHRKYNIKPDSEHYSCLVDIFGRAGRLDEAYQMIQNDENVSAWRTLLSACRNYGNARVAEQCARKIMEHDANDHASYILLSSLYSGEGKWEEALKLRQMMVDIGVKKTPGSSWLILRDRVHEFLVGDYSHHEIEEILREVNTMNRQVNNMGS